MRLELVALSAFVLCSLALAQDWREIKTPPTRRDPASMYAFVSLLDPLDDPAQWTAGAHDQSAQATVSLGEGRKPGERALRVAYEFLGPDRLEYVDIAGKLPIDPGVQAIGLWMRGGEQPLPARIRVVDSQGETHQFDLGTLVRDTWTLGVTALENGGHWGGDNNGKLDPPCHLASILFDKLGRGYRAKGDLTIAELGAYRRIPERLEPHGLKVFLPKERDLLVYERRQSVELAVAPDPADRSVSLPLKVSAQLVDPFGAVVRRAAVELRDQQPVPLTITPESPGAYDLRLRPAGREDDLDAPWADFRFAVLPRVNSMPKDSPFGVSTHFGQAWPLRVMPVIARAGIKFYRDEISWGSVEPERDQLSIPPARAAYIAEGARLGLEPLIIADYANRFYNDGGFPVSPEARAGFARYARALMTGLEPRLRYIEVWNEWCGGCGMGGRRGKAEQYAPLFLKAAAAIRAVEPDAVVVGIGGEWGGENLPSMMSGGAGAAMDAFSIHPYHYPQLPGQWLRDHLRQAAATAQAAAGKPVPLWITEIGWPTQMDARGSSFLHQARCLVRMMVIALTSGAHKVFWYDFKDDGHNLTYNEHNFGLVHHHDYLSAPKPAYVAYAHLIAALNGRKLLEQEVTPDGLWRTVYADDVRLVTVLFAAEQGQSIRFPLREGDRVEDLFGRPVAARRTLTVTWDPVFVLSSER